MDVNVYNISYKLKKKKILGKELTDDELDFLNAFDKEKYFFEKAEELFTPTEIINVKKLYSDIIQRLNDAQIYISNRFVYAVIIHYIKRVNQQTLADMYHFSPVSFRKNRNKILQVISIKEMEKIFYSPTLSDRADELLFVYFACTVFRAIENLTDEEKKLIAEICDFYKTKKLPPAKIEMIKKMEEMI